MDGIAREASRRNRWQSTNRSTPRGLVQEAEDQGTWLLTRADFPARRAAATRAAARAYGRQLKIDRRMAIPALLLPGLGNVCTQYLPPLVVARVLYAFGRANGRRLSLGSFAPYIALF